MKKNQEGWSLIELLVVMVIVGIVSSVALIGYSAVKKGTTDSVRVSRLLAFADAQNKYRTIKGKRRYATIKELCQEKLLPENVVKFDANCNPQPIDGWIIEDTYYGENINSLRDHFWAYLSKQNHDPDSGGPTFCIGEDGILRSKREADYTECYPGQAQPYQP